MFKQKGLKVGVILSPTKTGLMRNTKTSLDN